MKIDRVFPTLLLIFIFLGTIACAVPGLGMGRAPEPSPEMQSPQGTPGSMVTALPAAQPAGPGAPTDTPAPHTVTVPFVAADPSHSNTLLTATPGGSPSAGGQTPRKPLPASPGPKAQTLALDTIQPPPTGIFPRIEVLQSGGDTTGGEEGCVSRPGVPAWCHALGGAALSITQGYQNEACGLGSQPASAVVTLPDGSTLQASVAGPTAGCRSVSFFPEPGAPLGAYRVTLSQGAITLSDTFQLATPTEPAGALHANCAWLAGLPAGQPVRLLAFGLAEPEPGEPGVDPDLATWLYLSETRLTPDGGGAVLACPDAAGLDRYPEFAYLAILSNGRSIQIGDEDTLRQFQGECAGAPPTRLLGATRAQVVNSKLPLFPDPDLSEDPLAVLPRGTRVTLRGGPVCTSGGIWAWKVQTPTGLTGWLAENDQADYSIERVP